MPSVGGGGGVKRMHSEFRLIGGWEGGYLYVSSARGGYVFVAL